MANSIQLFLKNYRINVLKLSLLEVSEKTEVNYKTLSAFENGRSNNINHIYIYFKVCDNEQDLKTLQDGLYHAIEEGLKNG